MKIKAICMTFAALAAGCQNTVQSSATVTSQPASDSITKAQIETCWKQAGIKGDLYKFMTPEEAAGVRPGGVFTEQKHAKFTTCLKA